jgi:hypothetical protein
MVNLYRGYLDRVFMNPNGWGIVDYKTSAKANDPNYKDYLRLQLQIGLYAMGLTLDPKHSTLNSVLGGPKNLKYLYYLLLKTPQLRLKKGESIEDYRERCRLDEIKYLEQNDFVISVIHKFKPQEVLQELWTLIQAIRLCNRNNLWIMNREACFSYGKCPYFDLCYHGLKESLITAHFYRNGPDFEFTKKELERYENRW